MLTFWTQNAAGSSSLPVSLPSCLHRGLPNTCWSEALNIYHSVYYYLKWEVFLDCTTFVITTVSLKLLIHCIYPQLSPLYSSCFQLCACCGRFVSDYGPEGYDCVCQHRLLQALQGLNVRPEYVRTYPPCLLEWTANRKRAHTVLHIHCFDGENTHNCMWSDGLADILTQKVLTIPLLYLDLLALHLF